MRVCSEHFDSDRDYRRLPSVLRDAGQTMKNVYLKPGAVPSLRLPPTAKRLSPAKDPAVPTSKCRRTERSRPTCMKIRDPHGLRGRLARRTVLWAQTDGWESDLPTEDLETPDSSSTTAGSNSTTTAAAFVSTTTTSAVPPRRPGPACAMSPVLSDSDEEEEDK
ncbi:hypothetical protein HPB47_024790 [Ixodes persulcatus]|uniref:Uncharacterized protein n=1 Tax=Ixodes persulcatus TaxID=34615 RepID=A0AC60Q577_IXOPE|nr:hypothetical protein HPB47_024790 [Ixodes persulcatus]